MDTGRRRAFAGIAGWLVLGVFTARGPVASARTDTAASLFAAGRWQEAARAGEAMRTAAGLTLAARALVAEVLVERGAARGQAEIARAATLARGALQASPDYNEARLQLALALGLQARAMAPLEAFRSGMARESRGLIDAALAVDPGAAWGWTLLGGWHLEVLRRGGAAGAAVLGASERTGLTAFSRAVTAAPEDAAIRLFLASSLLELDAVRFAAQARAHLVAGERAGGRDAFNRAMAAKAGALGGVLARDGARAAAAAAARLYATGRL